MENEIVSAQVVLKHTSLAAVKMVTKAFTEAGFQVGPTVANNFSITAPARKFESYFGATPAASKVLPLVSVPAGIRDHIETVIIPAAPDFGPWGNF